MNRVELSGRLTRDPDVRYTDGGSTVARFTVAVDRAVKRDGGWAHEADFIGCVAFGGSAEFVEKYFRKGSFIIILGNIRTGSYEKDGQKVYTTDVYVEKAEFGGGRTQDREGVGNRGSGEAGEGFMDIPDGMDEELPFN